MNSSLALLVCIAGIAGLFFLDRDKQVRNSKALWLPVIWLWIVGSRPISMWLGSNLADQASSQQQLLEGSPVDRFVFQALLATGIIVLLRRKSRTSAFLKANALVLIYFAYCLVAVLWSDFPYVAFKRWIKAIGDLVMVLVVVTDAEPVVALRRLFSRTGFVLLPISILLIRYFGDLGRGYDPDGQAMNTGVTTNKNTLGLVTFVLSLGALWTVCAFLRARCQSNRGRHLLAHGTLLVFGVALLVMAHSATSAACFMVGAVLLLASSLPVIRRHPSTVHVVVALIALVAGLAILFGGEAAVTHAMGRQENLTGRTEIWAAVIRAVPNGVVGAGFESFWLGPRLKSVWSGLSQYMHVNEAHNGYIEAYLNLGWVGVSLIVLILISGYRNASAAFRRDPAVAGLMVAFVATAGIYSVTEAGFRMLSPIWIFLLLAKVGSAGPLSHARRKFQQRLGSEADSITGYRSVHAFAVSNPGPLAHVQPESLLFGQHNTDSTSGPTRH